MTKDELITYVEQAKGMMEENHAVPRVLWLSPEAYNIWTREVKDVPQLCDIEVRSTGDLPTGTYFAMTQEDEP